MHQVAIRMVHEAKKVNNSVLRDDSDKSQHFLTLADFDAAQTDFVPLSLRDVQLQKSAISWEDVGGRVYSSQCFSLTWSRSARSPQSTA